MPTVLACCDSFKDTATADEVNQTIVSAIQDATGMSASKINMSDGGEGFVSALQDAFNLSIVSVSVDGPLLSPITATYGLCEAKHLAVIELAAAAGIESVPVELRNPLNTSTSGLGTLIKDAYEKGARSILLGIGGSATNDAGLGALQSMGLQIHTKHGLLNETFCGKHLADVVDIVIPPELEEMVKRLSISVACDVTNPFVGGLGAVAVFSTQKGAGAAIKMELERGMENLARIIKHKFNVDVTDMSGAGAAGGVGGSFHALLRAELKPGVELIADNLGLEDAIKAANVVFTGEGSYDSQTAGGKVVSHVQKLCVKDMKPCIIVCGRNQMTETSHAAGTDLVWDLVSVYGKEQSMNNPCNSLQKLIESKKRDVISLIDDI
ncbi:hypothetical protein SARC_10420 [Sphaeroforma arctica JP610]|uniref:Glycerate kinase n=1 Tax=Sphaeroforma arctica JP610 TaxID=667725 RepID=A0A0L0FM65_9EUKA|nr:hypothetical protein SARC_10420 [Sphaeroforma arctica JP610]KNC77113.1 hypothetical protein SARC_10420 [Sphaeroforma arctica JP610]|eukprot:XP_014151015.1 hypothetical protein SARC_10420 [Sphaeroforma arctica JP610]